MVCSVVRVFVIDCLNRITFNIDWNTKLKKSDVSLIICQQSKRHQ